MSSNFTSGISSNSKHAKPVDKDTIVPFKVEQYWLSTIVTNQSLKYTTYLDTLGPKNRAGRYGCLLNNGKAEGFLKIFTAFVKQIEMRLACCYANKRANMIQTVSC